MSYRAVLGRLVSRTAVHIGTSVPGDVTDSIFRRDVEGNFVLPGTAIGGVLRSVATRLAPRLGSPVCRALWSTEEMGELSTIQRNQPCGCWVCHLFGDIQPGEGGSEKSGGRASRLIVAHARACSPDGKIPRVRDGVGIDRSTGASARAGSVKFDLEILPNGTEFALRLELEDTNANDEMLLVAALAEWQAGRAWIGGRTARGLGAFDLCDVRLMERELSSTDGLMRFLKAEAPWENATEIPDWLPFGLNKARRQLQGCTACHEGVARSFATVRFDLKIDGPFLINDTMAAVQSDFDHVPLLDKISTDGKPVLPGASLRGVLRSHAERIARTLITLNVGDRAVFLAKCPACNPVESRETAALANCDTLLRKVAKIPDEQEITDQQLCLACRLFGSTRRGSRFIVEDAEADAETLRKVLDFLAIDRFTGGGKKGAKFDAIALWQPTFHARLHLENPAAWELGWLTLVLRDLADGMLTIGLGGAKGFGRAKVASLSLDHGFIRDEDFVGPIQMVAKHTEPMSGLYRVRSWDTSDADQWAELSVLAQSWVDKFHKVVNAFERKPKLQLQEDSYFSDHLPTLYGKEDYRCLLNP